GTGTFEARNKLALYDVFGFELDRPLTPECARMTHFRIERPLPVLARLTGLSRHEAEIAGAERRTVTRDRGNIVARFEGLVLDLDAGARDRRHDLDLDRLAGARKPLVQV